MSDRLRKVIALMDSPAESEAAAAFRKARELLHQDGRRFCDLLDGAGNGAPAAGGRVPRDAAEVLALRRRVAELERELDDAQVRTESAHQGLDVVERHLDGLDRKYKTALDQKDRAIAKLRRQLAQAARDGHDRSGGASEIRAERRGHAVRPAGPRTPRAGRR